jgi:hypothetical protein
MDVGDLGGELEAAGVHVGDDDVAGADVAGDGGGHDADGARAGDQHVLADQVEAQRGVDGVAEGVEDRAHLVVDGVGEGDGVEGGQAQVFGEGTLFVDADAAGLGVEVEAPRARLAGGLADQVALARDALAYVEVVDVGAQRGDLAREFVPVTRGMGTVRAAQSSHFQMWMSVPQTPVCGRGSARRRGRSRAPGPPASPGPRRALP